MLTLTGILYIVSTALLIPVIVALLVLFTWSLLEIGGVLREWADRRRGRKIWRESTARVFGESGAESCPEARTEFLGQPNFPGFLGYFSQLAENRQDNLFRLDHLVARIEIRIAGSLSRMTFGSRVGPMLGLMGTLIPLGPALTGLASGDIQELTRNLVVAFSTTVLGLAAGGLFYGLGLIRRRWYAEDLAAIEFVMNAIEQPITPRESTR